MNKFFLALIMKSIISAVLFFTALPVYSFANPSDTTIKGVRVSFNYSPSNFPESWQDSPINAKAELIAASEIERSKLIISKALSKYPLAVLQTNLQSVYFFKSMKFYDVGYGGTNSTDALYLTNSGTAMGYTDSYLEQTFHHEFSSILFRNYPALLDTVEWKKTNVEGFDYNDPEAGVGAIRNGKSSQELDTALCTKGFLTQYACSSLENDVNTLAQNLFKPDPNFWPFVARFYRINKKVNLLMAFYHQVNPVFTEIYFRKFN